MMRRCREVVTLAILPVIAIVLGRAADASGQTILAGVSSATIAFSPQGTDPDLSGTRRTGFIGGVGFEVAPSDPGFWQVEVTFHQKGVRSLLRLNDAIRIGYIDVPVLMHMDLIQRGNGAVFFLVGPVASFAINATDEHDGGTEDIIDDINRFDLGLTVGGGVEGRRLKLEVRYTWGFRAPFVDGDLGGSFRHRTLVVMAGIRLR